MGKSSSMDWLKHTVCKGEGGAAIPLRKWIHVTKVGRHTVDMHEHKLFDFQCQTNSIVLPLFCGVTVARENFLLHKNVEGRSEK